MRTQSESIDSPTKGVMDYRIKMLSKTTCDGKLDALRASGIGTGPHKAAEYDPLGATVLERFDDYYGGMLGVAKMELIAIADQNARVAALQVGQIDFIYALSAEQVPLFANNPNFTVQSVPTGRWVGMVMNTQQAPFDDVRVHKAVRISVDRDALG